VELQGHVDCPSNYDEFLNVDQLIPTTEDQMATSFYIPDRHHMAYEWEEGMKGEEMQLFPAHPTWKDASVALSAPDTVICASDADEKIMTVMDDNQNF
jgi:hypothetical protein